MQKIVPNLWYDNQAEEAANFYVKVFNERPGGSQPQSAVREVAYFPKASEEVSGKAEGSVMTVVFELDGQRFVALNGGPNFKFSEAFSLIVYCADQTEVDYFWEQFTAGGGQESQCGWLKDKYGFSWQIVTKALDEMMVSGNKEGIERAMKEMLTMKKLDINKIQAAFAGK